MVYLQFMPDLERIKSTAYSLRSNNSKILRVTPVKGKKTLGNTQVFYAGFCARLWNVAFS